MTPTWHLGFFFALRVLQSRRCDINGVDGGEDALLSKHGVEKMPLFITDDDHDNRRRDLFGSLSLSDLI